MYYFLMIEFLVVKFVLIFDLDCRSFWEGNYNDRIIENFFFFI